MRSVEVIAEIGSNWLGDLSLGKELIKRTKEAGADAVKFQMWRARELYDESHPFWNEIAKSELSFEGATELKRFANQIGVDWFCSCFYSEAVDFLNKMGVTRFKIAHRRSERDFGVMRRISDTGKPVVLSTTKADDVRALLSIFKKTQDLTLLHCVPEYPTADERADMRRISDLMAFGRGVGLSDHTLGTVAPLGAVALGATMIEKHVKLDNSTAGPDAPVSITVAELGQLVGDIRRLEKMLEVGNGKVG